MRVWRFVYWFITGALLGLGMFNILDIPGLGLILFPVGLVLLVIGLGAVRGRERVAGVVGFGALPEAGFLNAFVTVQHFQFPSAFYAVGTLVFGVMTIVGVVGLVVIWQAPRRATGP